jgi:uncharacterized protein YndB with AHSA1/START domain
MTNNISLTVKRIIKAQRSKVFAAWTKPELVKRWYAPGTMSVPMAAVDFRVGGEYRIEMKDHSESYIATGTYQEIVPDELISFTWGWQGDPSPQTLVVVQFKDVDGGTEVTLTHDRFVNTESRDKHQDGWMGCLENLALYCDQ